MKWGISHTAGGFVLTQMLAGGIAAPSQAPEGAIRLLRFLRRRRDASIVYSHWNLLRKRQIHERCKEGKYPPTGSAV